MAYRPSTAVFEETTMEGKVMPTLFEKPNTLLRLEALGFLLLALVIYWQQGYSWTLFWTTVLLPDLALLGYLINARVGAVAYNMTHAKLIPVVLLLASLTSEQSLLLSLGLIWIVHIGFDRFLAYGLKYPEGFKVTHLGIIGKPNKQENIASTSLGR